MLVCGLSVANYGATPEPLTTLAPLDQPDRSDTRDESSHCQRSAATVAVGALTPRSPSTWRSWQTWLQGTAQTPGPTQETSKGSYGLSEQFGETNSYLIYLKKIRSCICLRTSW